MPVNSLLMRRHPVVCLRDLTHRWHCIQPPKPFWHHVLKKITYELEFMKTVIWNLCHRMRGVTAHSYIGRGYEYVIVILTCDYALCYNRQRCDTGQPGNVFPCQCVVKHGMYHLILISLYFGKSLKISVPSIFKIKVIFINCSQKQRSIRQSKS